MQFDQLFPLFGLLVFGSGICRNGNTGLLSDNPNSFRKRNCLSFHHERKDVASFSATKAVKALFLAMNRKRRCFFRMERAKCLKSVSSAFQRDVIRNHTDNIGSVANGFGEVLHQACRRYPKSEIRQDIRFI